MNSNKWLYVHTLPHVRPHSVRRSSLVWCIVLPFSLFWCVIHVNNCLSLIQILPGFPSLNLRCLYFSLLWICISFLCFETLPWMIPHCFPLCSFIVSALFHFLSCNDFFHQYCTISYPLRPLNLTTSLWWAEKIQNVLIFSMHFTHILYTHTTVHIVQLGEFWWSVFCCKNICRHQPDRLNRAEGTIDGETCWDSVTDSKLAKELSYLCLWSGLMTHRWRCLQLGGWGCMRRGRRKMCT